MLNEGDCTINVRKIPSYQAAGNYDIVEILRLVYQLGSPWFWADRWIHDHAKKPKSVWK